MGLCAYIRSGGAHSRFLFAPVFSFHKRSASIDFKKTRQSGVFRTIIGNWMGEAPAQPLICINAVLEKALSTVANAYVHMTVPACGYFIGKLNINRKAHGGETMTFTKFAKWFALCLAAFYASSQAIAATVAVAGESATLSGAGPYTNITPTSNRLGGRYGFLYLGDGRASATYHFSAPEAGSYALWIRFDDDGKHAPGARAVEIYVNGALALNWSNPSRETGGWVNIPVGTIGLAAGQNTIVFIKTATTSAAFVLDEFVLSNVPGFVPN